MNLWKSIPIFPYLVKTHLYGPHEISYFDQDIVHFSLISIESVWATKVCFCLMIKKSKSTWKLNFEAVHYPKNGLWEHIVLDFTDKEMSNEFTNSYRSI